MSLRPYSWRQAILKSDLPSTTRHVLITISCHVNDAGQAACVSTAKLAEETGLSERAVISHLKSTEGEWLITRKHGFGDQRWRGNEYLPRLPGDPSLDVEGTEPRSAPSAQNVNEGTEPRSAPSTQRGTERHDKKALNVLQGDNGFVLDLPPKAPPTPDLLAIGGGELEQWLDQEFWKRYPAKYRKDRRATLTAVAKLRPDATLLAEIVAGVDRRLRAEVILRERREFIEHWPHPKRFIANNRWRDEFPILIEARSTGNIDRRCRCGAPADVRVGDDWLCRPCKRATL